MWAGGWCSHQDASWPAPQPPYIKLPSGLDCLIFCVNVHQLPGRQVALPRGLSYSLISAGTISTLKELCLRRLHLLLPCSLSLSVSTSPGLALHLVSVHRPPCASGQPPGAPPDGTPSWPLCAPSTPGQPSDALGFPDQPPGNHPGDTSAVLPALHRAAAVPHHLHLPQHLHHLGLPASLVSIVDAGNNSVPEPLSFVLDGLIFSVNLEIPRSNLLLLQPSLLHSPIFRSFN